MPRLSVHVLGDGERVPMLSDGRGLPLFFPTLFATAQLRNAGAAVNTIRNKLADIQVLLRWERLNGRDLIAEFAHGKFPSLSDIVSIRDFAKLNMRGVPESSSKSALCSGNTGVILDFPEARISKVSARPTVNPQQHYNRVSTIADYLEFCASVVTQHRNSPDIAQQIAQMAKSLRKHRPRGLIKQLQDDADLRSPPSHVVERFMEVGAENSPQNPFRSPDVRLRNAIIFGLLRYTGMRRGELLSLRVDQFEFGHEPRVWIRRNQDDKHDSRRYQPVSKTKERPLPIPDELAEQIQRYIMQVRAKITPARKHPYLLVTHRKGTTWGKPLSLSSLSALVFARMHAVDPEFAQIHPHAFRHHFNYELSVSIDAINAAARKGVADAPGTTSISDGVEMDVRAFLNGHRSKASSAIYNRRHIREKSDVAARAVQSGLTQHRKANANDEPQD